MTLTQEGWRDDLDTRGDAETSWHEWHTETSYMSGMKGWPWQEWVEEVTLMPSGGEETTVTRRGLGGGRGVKRWPWHKWDEEMTLTRLGGVGGGEGEETTMTKVGWRDGLDKSGMQRAMCRDDLDQRGVEEWSWTRLIRCRVSVWSWTRLIRCRVSVWSWTCLNQM